jgi:hypothetical protein
MVSRFRAELRRPSPAFVLSAIALFVALGGTGAYAVDRVSSKEIGNGEVRRVDLDRNAVGSKQVANESLKGVDLASEPKINFTTATILPGQTDGITANCPRGQIVSGGGWLLDEGPVSALDAASSSPSAPQRGATANGWIAVLRNSGDTNVTVSAIAMCAPG